MRRRFDRRIGGLALAAFAWAVGSVRAQDAEERIGLVLSGGGARGCAHVGVLKVLEELRIPIHCVAGTSMGSIVGGFYAYGLSPERLEQEMTRAGNRRPWAVLLQDQAPRRYRSFRRKQEDFEFLVDFGLGIRDGGLHLPKGLTQGQNLELELTGLAPGGHALATFDDLPLRFRAVAVELRTGRPVVLDSGSLPMAMRASMSLPGVFAPAVVGGVEMLDGGLVENVPIAVARSMGATRVIVVDIGTPVQVEQVGSALEVSTQMVQILTQQNVDRSLALVGDGDVLLQPELGDITSSDFDRAAEAIAIGEAAARAAADRLRRYSVPVAEFERFLRRQRRTDPPVVVHEVRLENRSGLADAVLLDRLEVRPGQVLDVEVLRRDLECIHGIGDFEHVGYELLPVAAGQHDLVIHATEKSWGPTYLKFGLALTSNLEGRSAFTLATQANVRQIDDLGAEWRTTVSFGDTSGFDSEYYQPVVASGTWFVAPRLATVLREATAFGATLDLTLYSAGVDLGFNVGTCSQLRVGVTRLRGEVDVTSFVPVSGFDFDDGAIEARWISDTFDDGTFPTSGVRVGAQWFWGTEELGADADYQQLMVAGVGYGSVGRTTLGIGVSYVTALDQELPIYRRPSLGGFTRLSGLDDNSLGGQHTGFVGVLLRHRLAGRKETFGFPVYLGGTIEAGDAWDRRDEVWRSLRLSGSVFLAIDTPIGPTYVAYGQSEGGEHTLYLFVGQPF